MEARSKLERNNLPQKSTIVLELGKTKDVEEEPTLVQDGKYVRARTRGDPPRIKTAQGGNRDTRQGKQSQEVSSEVWENRGAKRRGDKREKEEILSWRPGS